MGPLTSGLHNWTHLELRDTAGSLDHRHPSTLAPLPPSWWPRLGRSSRRNQSGVSGMSRHWGTWYWRLFFRFSLTRQFRSNEITYTLTILWIKHTRSRHQSVRETTNSLHWGWTTRLLRSLQAIKRLGVHTNWLDLADFVWPYTVASQTHRTIVKMTTVQVP